MITEDYVSFETAILLKEKGFNVPCLNYYDSTKTIRMSYDYGGVADVWANFNEIDDAMCSAPTIQMAMKWLREEHNLFIGIHPRLSFTDYYWITADIYRVKKKSSLYHVEDVDDYNCAASCDGTSFEDACGAAIKYCLENLI